MVQPRVIVIGAGIVGASCAYYLAEHGADVTVLEKAANPATGSTAKSAAGLRHQFSHPENVRMSLYSAAVFKQFENLTGVKAGFRRSGYLFLLKSEHWPNWLKQVDMQRHLGARVEVLDKEELKGRFPAVATAQLAGASFGPDDGVIDPHSVTLGYLRAAKALGANLRLNSEVLKLRAKAGMWQVSTKTANQNTNWRADFVVNAAGPFAAEIAGRAGLEIPLQPYRRNVYVTGPLPTYPHPSPLMVDMATGVWLRSEGQRFIMGLAKRDEPPGFEQAVDWQWLEQVLELALPRFPFLESAALDAKSCWAGLYAITPDHLPILGEMPAAPGFVNACGFSGHGVQHSPATGLIIAEELMLGDVKSFDISRFRYERFSRPGTFIEQNVV